MPSTQKTRFFVPFSLCPEIVDMACTDTRPNRRNEVIDDCLRFLFASKQTYLFNVWFGSPYWQHLENEKFQELFFHTFGYDLCDVIKALEEDEHLHCAMLHVDSCQCHPIEYDSPCPGCLRLPDDEIQEAVGLLHLRRIEEENDLLAENFVKCGEFETMI